MKVTKKILSIPPYVSTAWQHVAALRLEGGALIVEMFNGTQVSIPGLDEAALDQIFSAHEIFLEEETSTPDEGSAIAQLMSDAQQLGEEVIGLPLRFGVGGFEGMGNGAMQHDPSQAESPDLPHEIIEKIAGISQILGAENATQLPEAVSGCNCFHCQIARAINHGSAQSQEEELLEEVTDEDLKFREWDIEEMADGVYQVSNPLDKNEEYKVCLKPVGCNCGREGCEHVTAVLKS